MSVLLFLPLLFFFTDGLGLPSFEDSCDDNMGTKSRIKTIEINMVRYRTLTGQFPRTLQDFAAKPENPPIEWRRLMLPEALLDHWGEPYQYRNPGLKNPNGYDLFSKGPDKTEGTEDDIGNWQ